MSETAEHKDKLRKLKAETVDHLQTVDVDSYALDKADKRLKRYIVGCINNPDGHNLYELLAINAFSLSWANMILGLKN